MRGCTLLIHHLPSSLSKEEKEDFLRYFGAARVDVMGNKGPLKHAAFAEFPSQDVAAQVMSKLHQVEVLGCRLVVEFARDTNDQHLPSVTNGEHRPVKQEANEEGEKEETQGEDQETDPTDLTSHHWRLKYPRQRRLHYLYPPPSPAILANINNALAACPRFYVQVLHLMNKMDLPPPFGLVTAQPPLAPDTEVTLTSEDKLQTEEMEVSSSEESELESDTEMDSTGQKDLLQKKKTESRKRTKKRSYPKVAMFQASRQAADSKSVTPAVPLEEMFEQSREVGGQQRKIQLKLPAAVSDSSTTQAPEPQGAVPAPTPDWEQAEPSLMSVEAATQETEGAGAQSSGFGLITPVVKPADDSEDQDQGEGWTKTKFISRSELRKGRLSRRKWKTTVCLETTKKENQVVDCTSRILPSR